MQHLLLLHGAIGAKDQLNKLAETLEKNHHVHLLNFAGHGGEQIPEESFSIDLFAQNILDYLQQQNIEQTNIFGYSMGGYVGMYIAKFYPEKINRLITLATKFYWDAVTAAKEIKMMDATTIEEKVPAFANELGQRHAPQNWKIVLQKSAEMLYELGKNNVLKDEHYKDISKPCLLMLGDRDKMVTLDETINVYKQLPNAQFCILPNTQHPIDRTDKNLLAYMINHFLH